MGEGVLECDRLLVALMRRHRGHWALREGGGCWKDRQEGLCARGQQRGPSLGSHGRGKVCQASVPPWPPPPALSPPRAISRFHGTHFPFQRAILWPPLGEGTVSLCSSVIVILIKPAAAARPPFMDS